MEAKIKKISENVTEDICIIPKKIYDDLKISRKNIYKIHLGQLSTSCLIRPSVKTTQDMYCSKSIFNQLLLYNDVILNIYKKDNDIYLGPVVGIFVTTEFIKIMDRGGRPTTAIDHIEEAAPLENSLCYCFTINNIDWKNKRIKGYTLIPGINKWEYRWLPMPDIFYDRGAYFSMDEKPIAKEVRDNFKNNTDVRFINNHGSLGKWPLYKRLSQYPEIKEYLPETIEYTSFEDVISMLKKYGFIFIKSSLGSRGEEVLSIKQLDGEYRIDYFEGNLKIKYVSEIEMVKDHIEKFINEKTAKGRVKFIIQQGIKLIRCEGDILDLRIHIVKNEEGIWKATNFYSSISRNDSTITNSCVGGKFVLYASVYSKLVEEHKNIKIPKEDELEKIIIKIAAFIEKAFGDMGEIGIDMAIDETGKMWFLEGNARPDKFRIRGIDNMEGASPQSLATFQYSKYLFKKKIFGE